MASEDKISEPARESFLYRLWLERDLSRAALTTVDGHEVAILEKGVRNYDAGADFSAALIRYQGQILRGDVEIHSLAGDWYHHGHHKDARYNSVILHVVTMFCPRDFCTVRQDGTLVPTLNLDAFLETSAEALQEEAEESAVVLASGSCRLAHESEHRQWQVIRAQSDKRLQIHKQQFAELRAVESWDQIFYMSVLTALGYAKNQLPFRRLAQILPVETIWKYIWNDPPQQAQRKSEAYLLGASGLLDAPADDAEDVGSYHNALKQLWQEFPERRKIDTMKTEQWQFFRLRPANFPTRRIAAAAVIILRFMEKGFVDTLLQPLWACNHKLKKCFADWQGKWTVRRHPFWSQHYRFERAQYRIGKNDGKIIGEDRSQDITVNVVIPGLLAYAEEVEDGRLQNLLQEAYYEHPRLCGNELTRRMEERLFHAAPKQTICEFAWQQQGLIQIAKTQCTEGVCAACMYPFY